MISIRHLLSGAALSAAVLVGCGGAAKKEPSTTAFYTPDESNEDQILVSEAPPAPAPRPEPAKAKAPEVAAADSEAADGGEMVFEEDAAPAKAAPAKKAHKSRRHRKHR